MHSRNANNGEEGNMSEPEDPFGSLVQEIEEEYKEFVKRTTNIGETMEFRLADSVSYRRLRDCSGETPASIFRRLRELLLQDKFLTSWPVPSGGMVIEVIFEKHVRMTPSVRKLGSECHAQVVAHSCC